MMKSRKITLLWLLIVAVCAIAFCLCACSSGTDGANGTNGKDGSNGKSAYEIWLDEGHTGSQADFLDWLKGTDGQDGNNGTDGATGQNGADGKSAYEIFKQQYPYYQGTEEQWLIELVNGQLRINTVTFKSEVSDDITKYVLNGYALSEIPEVPEKEGQTSAAWSITDFSSITQDIEVNAVYDMRKYITFHNEFTDDEDIVKVVNYGEALTDIPNITEKLNNDSKWSVTDFSEIKTDLLVEAIYQTQGLQFTLINQQTQYRVSKGEMNTQTSELFIPAENSGKAVTVIDTSAFYDCRFKSAHIPDSITEIRDSAFSYCSSLTSITIPNSVTSIGSYAFMGCSSLTSITIPNSITEIRDSAFWNCSSLTSITIPNSVTSIGSRAFCNCSSLTSIEIPNSITSIGDNTFYNCSSLTSITIPDSVTSIGIYAFSYCSNLTSITIPNSVTSIGIYAFEGCSKLETIYFKGTEVVFNQIRIYEGNTSFTDAMVYYYFETEPTDSGNYWHYDTDGKTPVVWVK